jgi:hypothetical protein
MLPTDRWTRVLIAPALVFIATAIDRNYQTDLWHHLARGRLIAAEGRLLDEERFTYTIPGQPLQDSNWLWQVASYQLYKLGGFSLVQTVNSSILALMMAALVLLCRRRSGSLAAAAGICLLVFFGLWQMLLIRPQTFSLMLFVLLYGCLERALARPCWLFVAPLILAVWANVHGGFPVGLALVACYAGAVFFGTWGQRSSGRAFLPWALCLMGCLGATLANPYGWHIYEYVLRTSRVASGRRIDEWLPPGIELLAAKVWVLSVLLLLGLSLWNCKGPARDRRLVWRDLLLVGCFLPAACGSVRMVAWWLLVSAPLLAQQLAELWPQLRREDPAADRPNVGAALSVAGLVLGMVLNLPWLERFNPVFMLPGRSHRVESDLQAIADRISTAKPTGRIFTRFCWGEYFGWALAGRFSVFMDGRIEIFPDEVWAQYSAVVRGRADWELILSSYGVDCLVLDPSGYHHELLPLIEASPNWRRVCQQGDAILFVRQEPVSSPSAS